MSWCSCPLTHKDRPFTPDTQAEGGNQLPVRAVRADPNGRAEKRYDAPDCGLLPRP
jgi:hypothetical protein